MGGIPKPTRDAERSVERDGEERRWVSGSGGEIPEHGSVEPLVEHGVGHRRRWSAADNVVDDGLDRVQTERLLWRLLDAGLVAIHQRRDRIGNWECYEWTTTERGERFVEGGGESEAVDPSAYLSNGGEDDKHPVLANIREALEGDLPESSPRVARMVMALGRQLRRGRRPADRELSLAATGTSKRIDPTDWREELESVLDCRLEEVVRVSSRVVHAWGDFRFEVRGRPITGDWSIPWLAITEETMEGMEGLVTDAGRIVTVENRTTFESFVREERPSDTVVVYTAGFAGSLQLDFLRRLLEAGIERVDHWGDLDVGGLRILRHLDEELAAEVCPFRMASELLDEFPTRPLTDSDRRALEQWLDAPDRPYHRLARELLERDAKAEQEAWYVVRGSRS